jgi:serine/threonine protein phosphatase PrpC
MTIAVSGLRRSGSGQSSTANQLLLGTDGLTDMVDNETIGSVLKNGGKDNVTIALARYRIPQ